MKEYTKPEEYAGRVLELMDAFDGVAVHGVLLHNAVWLLSNLGALKNSPEDIALGMLSMAKERTQMMDISYRLPMHPKTLARRLKDPFPNGLNRPAYNSLWETVSFVVGRERKTAPRAPEKFWLEFVKECIPEVYSKMAHWGSPVYFGALAPSRSRNHPDAKVISPGVIVDAGKFNLYILGSLYKTDNSDFINNRCNGGCGHTLKRIIGLMNLSMANNNYDSSKKMFNSLAEGTIIL